MTFDLVVVGGGPAGFAAATEAAGRGLSTALVEADLMGGTCLNRGCIPTKLMLAAVAPSMELGAQARLGVLSGEITTNFPALRKRTDMLLNSTRKAMAAKLKQAGVAVYRGRAEITGPGRVRVDSPVETTDLACAMLLIATGSRPSHLPGMAPDGKRILDSDGFLALEEMPESLIVVGAGFIGLEMAQAANGMGAAITLVEAADRIAPAEDPEVSKALASLLKRRKYAIHTNARVRSLATEGDQAVLALESGETFQARTALVAAGRRPNTEGLGLEALGLSLTPQGYIPTDGHLLAGENVYAVGDVNGRLLLAHAATRQAELAVAHMAGETVRPYESGWTPSILYGSPEVMRTGRPAHEITDARVSRAMLAANPMAQAHGSPQGFVKIAWDGDRVAGVTAVGEGVSRLAVAASMIVSEGWTLDAVKAECFPHPTLDESLLQALAAPRE